jgi:hypothetical protein
MERACRNRFRGCGMPVPVMYSRAFMRDGRTISVIVLQQNQSQTDTPGWRDKLL